jgi:uridine kinase
LLNQNLNDLFAGKCIDIPKFSFIDGQRFYDGEKLQIDDKNIILAEGIHALNPKLTALIPNNIKLKFTCRL